MPHWIFQKVVMRNKFLSWSGLRERKELQKEYDSFCDPVILCFGVGVAQLLDIFSETSLAAQKLEFSRIIGNQNQRFRCRIIKNI